MTKKKSQAKELISYGIGSMAGLGAMGAIGGIPGMPAAGKTLTTTVGAGLNIGAIGQMANIGLNIMPKTGKKSKKLKW
jgi:hypothetical protein